MQHFHLIVIAKIQPKDLKLDAKENSELVLVDWHQKHEKTQAAKKNHLRWKQEKGVHYHVIMYQAMIRICHISNYDIGSHYNFDTWDDKKLPRQRGQEATGGEASACTNLQQRPRAGWPASCSVIVSFFLSFFYNEEVVQHAGFGVFNVTIRK